MNNTEYNNMFSISPIKLKFFDSKTGSTKHLGFDRRASFDLSNENTYDLKGNLIEKATQQIYNTHFLLHFSRCDVLHAQEFLNYHFDRTPDKSKFLDYLEFGIYEDAIIKGGIKTMMRKWIDNKRESEKEQNPTKCYDEFILRFNEFFDNVFYHFKSETLIAKDVKNMQGIGLIAQQLKNKLKIDFSKEGKAIERQINKIKSDFTILSQKFEKANKKHKFGHIDNINRAVDLLNVAQVFWDTYDFVREYGIFEGMEIIVKNEIKGNDVKANLVTNGFDTNKWNLKTYQLFLYLIENYENDKNVKYINIYYFLKDLSKESNTEYRLSFIIEDYKAYILKEYNVKLTKFERAIYKFKDIEVPKLKDLLKIHNTKLK